MMSKISKQLQEIGRALRAVIMQGSIPQEIAQEISTAYAQTFAALWSAGSVMLRYDHRYC